MDFVGLHRRVYGHACFALRATRKFGIGKRNKKLNEATVRAARAICPLDIDYGPDNRCEPVDLLQHLTSDHSKKKFEEQATATRT